MARPRNSLFRPRPEPRRLWLTAAVALLFAAPSHAVPPSHRPPLGERLLASVFLPADPGYLPLVGPPPLRFGAVAQAPAPIRPPPLALYAPPVPKPPETVAPVATTPTPPAPETNDSAKVERKQPPVRPEDLLPYFQLNDGASGGAPGSLQFTPAQPASRAEYRQQ